MAFTDIVDTVAALLAEHRVTRHDVSSDPATLSVDDVLAADAWARDRASDQLKDNERMTVLTYTLGVLLFAVGVAASIGLHEIGHLIPGKLFNVKVTQFFVGFGRTIWSTQKGETEYGLKAIPLGGYCKLVGMVPPEPDEEPDRVAQPQHRDVRPAGQRRPLGGVRARRPRGPRPALLQQALVAADHHHGLRGGHQPGARLLPVRDRLHGLRHPAGHHHGRAASRECVIAVTKANVDQPHARLHRRRPGGPGQGGRVPARRPDRLVQRHRDHHLAAGAEGDPGQRRRDGEVTVERNGKQVVLHPTTTVTTATVDPDNPEKITKVGFLGVVPTTERERQGVGYVVSTMADGTWQTLQTIAALPMKVYHVGRAALGLEERDPNGPMSVVGAGRVAGEMASEQVDARARPVLLR